MIDVEILQVLMFPFGATFHLSFQCSTKEQLTWSNCVDCVPIHTSPNCPLPSLLINWRDSRGISQTSLVLTDRSVSLGIPLWQGTTKRQHRPAALSDRHEKRRQRVKKQCHTHNRSKARYLKRETYDWRQLKAKGHVQDAYFLGTRETWYFKGLFCTYIFVRRLRPV